MWFEAWVFPVLAGPLWPTAPVDPTRPAPKPRIWRSGDEPRGPGVLFARGNRLRHKTENSRWFFVFSYFQSPSLPRWGLGRKVSAMRAKKPAGRRNGVLITDLTGPGGGARKYPCLPMYSTSGPSTTIFSPGRRPDVLPTKGPWRPPSAKSVQREFSLSESHATGVNGAAGKKIKPRGGNCRAAWRGRVAAASTELPILRVGFRHFAGRGNVIGG